MRTPEQLERHYMIEKELADRLKSAPPAARLSLYTDIYDELFRRVPDHPQLTRRDDDEARQEGVRERFELLSRFLGKDTVFLEVGAGDGSLSRYVAPLVAKCYALDVSQEMLQGVAMRGAPPNMETVLSDGRSIDVGHQHVTVAYSYQVMEHIHPDDAKAQLANIYRALAPGGIYLCVTPNRLNGPHDISQYFEHAATGLHLKEYTVTELKKLFEAVGFTRTEAYVGFRGRYFRVPARLLEGLEFAFRLCPSILRRRIGRSRGLQNLLFISLAGIK